MTVLRTLLTQKRQLYSGKHRVVVVVDSVTIFVFRHRGSFDRLNDENPSGQEIPSYVYKAATLCLPLGFFMLSCGLDTVDI